MAASANEMASGGNAMSGAVHDAAVDVYTQGSVADVHRPHWGASSKVAQLGARSELASSVVRHDEGVSDLDQRRRERSSTFWIPLTISGPSQASLIRRRPTLNSS